MTRREISVTLPLMGAGNRVLVVLLAGAAALAVVLAFAAGDGQRAVAG